MSHGPQRVELTPGLVLHQRPWRDSSLIVDLFTLHHGRLTAFARGVRGARPGPARFAQLQPFQPLLLSWFGRGEAPRLTGAEPDGERVQLPPAALLSAYYLNELLLKLTAQHDAQPEIFACYRQALLALAAGEHCEWVLRRFEKQLLELLGFGLDLTADCGGHYRYATGVGMVRAEAGQARAVSGRVLRALAEDAPQADSADWRAARDLMRVAIDHCLDGRELRTRQVARALARVENAGHE